MQAVETSQTLGDLMLRLAERTGLALYDEDAAAALPEDADDLAKLKRYVNDGYDRFLRAWPYWTFLDQDITLTLSATGTAPESIEGQSWRYRLPPYVSGAPRGNWRYADQTSRYVEALSVDRRIVLARRQSIEGSGPPRYAAVRRLEVREKVAGGSRIGWELILEPSPDAAYVLENTFRVRSHVLRERDERHICGADHDAAIAAFAAAAWFEDDAEQQDKAREMKAAAAERLAESIAIDKQARPPTVGRVVDPSICREPVGRSRLPRVGTHNGVAIPYD